VTSLWAAMAIVLQVLRVLWVLSYRKASLGFAL